MSRKSGLPVVVRADNRRIMSFHEHRSGGIANIDVFKVHIVNQSVARDIRLDAHTVVGAIDGKIGNADCGCPSADLAADRHTVSRIEMVVQDAHMCCVRAFIRRADV